MSSNRPSETGHRLEKLTANATRKFFGVFTLRRKPEAPEGENLPAYFAGVPLDARTFYLLLALSLIYGWAFVAMFYANRATSTGTEIAAMMQSLVDREQVGSGSQTRLLVPYIFTYISPLVGGISTMLLIETTSVFWRGLGYIIVSSIIRLFVAIDY